MRNISESCFAVAQLALTDLAADGRPSLRRHLHGGDGLAARRAPVPLNLHLRRWEGQRNAVNRRANATPWLPHSSAGSQVGSDTAV